MPAGRGGGVDLASPPRSIPGHPDIENLAQMPEPGTPSWGDLWLCKEWELMASARAQLRTHGPFE